MLRLWICLPAAPLLAGACNDQPPLLAPDSTVIPSSVVAGSVLVVNGSEAWV